MSKLDDMVKKFHELGFAIDECSGGTDGLICVVISDDAWERIDRYSHFKHASITDLGCGDMRVRKVEMIKESTLNYFKDLSRIEREKEFNKWINNLEKGNDDE